MENDVIVLCLFMSWLSELVVAGGVYPSNIAVDSKGNPYVLVVGHNPDVQLARNMILFSKAHGTWVADTFEDFADNPEDGINGDIVIDCFDRIWVVYKVYYPDGPMHDSNHVVVACKDTGFWTKDTVQSGLYSNFYQSIATDSKGNPHVTYDFYVGDPHYWNYAYYAYFDGDSWNTEIIDTAIANYDCSIDIDADDNPHIVYYRRHSFWDSLYRATKVRGNWVYDAIDEGDLWMMSSIRIGPDNLPNIVYNGWGGVRFAYSHNNVWYTELIDVGGAYFQKSIDTDSTGRQYVVYSHDNKTWLGHRVGDGDWHKEMLPESSVWDAEGSIRIDRHGGIHIARISGDGIYYIYGNVGIEEIRQEKFVPVHVCPNPFRESVTLDFDGSQDVIVYDITGRIVKDFGLTHKLTWNAKEISSGVYFCRIGISVIKLVKN